MISYNFINTRIFLNWFIYDSLQYIVYNQNTVTTGVLTSMILFN